MTFSLFFASGASFTFLIMFLLLSGTIGLEAFYVLVNRMNAYALLGKYKVFDGLIVHYGIPVLTVWCRRLAPFALLGSLLLLSVTVGVFGYILMTLTSRLSGSQTYFLGPLFFLSLAGLLHILRYAQHVIAKISKRKE